MHPRCRPAASCLLPLRRCKLFHLGYCARSGSGRAARGRPGGRTSRRHCCPASAPSRCAAAQHALSTTSRSRARRLGWWAGHVHGPRRQRSRTRSTQPTTGWWASNEATGTLCHLRLSAGASRRLCCRRCRSCSLLLRAGEHGGGQAARLQALLLLWALGRVHGGILLGQQLLLLLGLVLALPLERVQIASQVHHICGRGTTQAKYCPNFVASRLRGCNGKRAQPVKQAMREQTKSGSRCARPLLPTCLQRGCWTVAACHEPWLSAAAAPRHPPLHCLRWRYWLSSIPARPSRGDAVIGTPPLASGPAAAPGLPSLVGGPCGEQSGVDAPQTGRM